MHIPPTVTKVFFDTTILVFLAFVCNTIILIKSNKATSKIIYKNVPSQ